METAEFLRQYGWTAFLVIWLLDKFFPRFWAFFTDKVFPARARERAQRLEQDELDARAKRDAEAQLLKAKIDREMREEETRRQFEDRIATAIQQMTLAITVNNERLGHLSNSMAEHDRFTLDAVGDMRESVIKLHKRETQPKMKRSRGPTRQ